MRARWLCIVVGGQRDAWVRFSEERRETEEDGDRWTVKATGRVAYAAAVGDTLAEQHAQWRVESVSAVSTRRSVEVVLVRRWHVGETAEVDVGAADGECIFGCVQLMRSDEVRVLHDAKDTAGTTRAS